MEAVVALILSSMLSACSSNAEEDAPVAESTSSTPTPTPTAATEAQLASVIAGYEKDWREVISEAGDCRFKFVMKDPGPLPRTERLICYMREVTIGATTAEAISDLDALTPPDSMASLISETKAAFQAVADVDLESVCGRPMSEIRDSRDCGRALGSRMWAYRNLETALDMWSPYL